MDDTLKNRYFSSIRLNAYDNFEEYRQNLKQSKEYYIPLAILEISLRNSIDTYFKSEFGADWLNSEFLHPDSLKKIEEVKKRVLLANKIVTSDQIISELSFGFWTALFRNSYSQTMRIKAIKSIFSNLPNKEKKLITRDYINKKLNHIRKFRNRVFHFEKIIYKEEFNTIQNDMDEILSFLNDGIYTFSKQLNRGE